MTAAPNKNSCDIKADLIFKELLELLMAKHIILREEWVEDMGGREFLEAQRKAIQSTKLALREVVWAEAQFSF